MKVVLVRVSFSYSYVLFNAIDVTEEKYWMHKKVCGSMHIAWRRKRYDEWYSV